MKKILALAAMCLAFMVTSCDGFLSFDDSKLWESIQDLEDRVEVLEELCARMNTNISSLQAVVTALEGNDYVANVAPILKDGETIGYTVTFVRSGSITIYNGKDGQDGKDGADGKDGKTPVIGVGKDTDGVYYWTLDGEWLLGPDGDKIKVAGEDGADGSPGADGRPGADGAAGKDGMTPKLKIEDGHWFVSYDEGRSWENLGKATGEDGKDGKDGKDGEDGVQISQDDNNVYFTLADGTVITVPKNAENEVPDILLDKSVVDFTSDGGREAITFTSPSSWIASVISSTEEDWISISPSSGSEGESRIVIEAYPDSTPENHLAFIVLKAGDVEKTITVTQKQNDVIVLEKDNYSLDCGGGQIQLEIGSNVEYEVSVSADWIEQIVSKAYVNDVLIFNVAENLTVKDREGTIKINSNDETISKVVRISQSGYKASSLIGQVANITLVSADVVCSFSDVPSGAECRIHITGGGLKEPLVFAAQPNMANQTVAVSGLAPMQKYTVKSCIVYNETEYYGTQNLTFTTLTPDVTGEWTCVESDGDSYTFTLHADGTATATGYGGYESCKWQLTNKGLLNVTMTLYANQMNYAFVFWKGSVDNMHNPTEATGRLSSAMGSQVGGHEHVGDTYVMTKKD